MGTQGVAERPELVDVSNASADGHGAQEHSDVWPAAQPAAADACSAVGAVGLTIPGRQLQGHGSCDQMLRIETMPDKHARRLTGVIKLCLLLCILGIVAITVVKELPGAGGASGSLIVLNQGYLIAQAAIVALLAIALNALVASDLYRITVSIRLRRKWSARRKRPLTRSLVRAAMVNAILLPIIVSSSLRAAHAGWFCKPPVFISVCEGVHWLGWNTFLCAVTVDARGLVLRPTPEWPDRHVADLPLWHNWPYFVLWLAAAGVTVWAMSQNITRQHGLDITQVDGNCHFGAQLQCSTPASALVAVALWCAVAAVYIIMVYWFLVQTLLQLRKRLYQDFRMMRQIVQLQIRYATVVMITLAFTFLAFWFFGKDPCANYTVAWMGSLPMMLAATVFACTLLFNTQPRIPSDGVARPIWLQQQWAWTDEQAQMTIARRWSYIQTGVSQDVLREPMFTMERTIKCFSWACLMYDSTATGIDSAALANETVVHTATKSKGTSTSHSSDPGASERCESTQRLASLLDTAMDLFDLQQRCLFYDAKLQTHIAVAHSGTAIMVAARGTAAVANALEDIKFVQTNLNHTHERKALRVHRGFLMSWAPHGIGKQVVEHVRACLDAAPDRSAVQIMVTGHSLGGAIATLAAYDIARQLDVPPDCIACYTFGCPRVGNHAFAEAYRTVVPDTWHLVNDQDIVVHSMKVFGWYKRNGNRTLINRHGDIVVRPSLLELSLLQSPFRKSVGHHTLASYYAALSSIIRAHANLERADCAVNLSKLQQLQSLLHDLHEMRATLHATVKREAAAGVEVAQQTRRQLGKHVWSRKGSTSTLNGTPESSNPQ